MKKLLPFLSLLIAITISCNFIPLAMPPSIELDAGTLVVYMESDPTVFKAATITPPDLSIGSYVINGSSGIETFGPEIKNFPDDVCIIPGLAEGLWDITVNAYDGVDGTGSIIATDTAQATVTDNDIAEVDILVVPLTGTGTSGSFQLDLVWNPDSFNIPNFTTVTLDATDYSASISNIDSVVGTADFDGTIEAGYYTLTITLEDDAADGTLPKTIIAAIRIIDNAISPTTGTLDFSDPGSMTINLNSDLKNPFDIVFSGHSPSLSKATADTMTVNALIDELPTPVAGDSYAWYLNGAIQSSTIEDIIIDSATLAIGYYTLTVVIGRDGALSSDDITFTVEE